MGHYETLGVAPTASAQEIRDAYRRLARQHHPDRAADDGDAMAALNEAYRVLRNPGRRARYDAERRRPTRREPSPEASVTEAPPAVDVVRGGAGNGGPARYPWKLVLVLATLGVGIVLIGAALFEPTAPEDPDNLLEPGSCVAIEDNGDVREVRCQGTSDDLVVRQVVPFDGFCPVGLDAHRDRQGLGIACVSRLD